MGSSPTSGIFFFIFNESPTTFKMRNWDFKNRKKYFDLNLTSHWPKLDLILAKTSFIVISSLIIFLWDWRKKEIWFILSILDWPSVTGNHLNFTCCSQWSTNRLVLDRARLGPAKFPNLGTDQDQQNIENLRLIRTGRRQSVDPCWKTYDYF